MGFALWTDHDTAWAAGTHEYRPMGVAVIAGSNLFTARDFRAAHSSGANGPEFPGVVCLVERRQSLFGAITFTSEQKEFAPRLKSPIGNYIARIVASRPK